MRQQVSLEMKVGAFIVTGVALLLFLLFAIGDVSTYFQPGYRFRVMFDSANGIGRGSPVQYAGVEVGKVEEVRIIYANDRPSPQVEVVARLPQDVRLRADDEAAISTFGLLGEKYLEIRPGPGQEAMLEPGQLLTGKPTVSTERIIERSNEVLSEFKRTLEGLNSLVGDQEARIYLKEALEEARNATRTWRLLGERMNVELSSVESGHGTIGKLLFDEELYQLLLSFVQDLQQHPWKLLARPKEADKPSQKK